ncbi:phospholipid carrier-dependent glycosyltransferase [bacterium]|nr:MAG: phospholipid carrier-dependent glycosyltransferase [bacterium]
MTLTTTLSEPQETVRVGQVRPLYLDLAVLLFPALAKLLLQLFAIRGYGLNGDELYYLACSEHLDWGYVDQPPLSIFLLWLERAILGDSHFAIRLLPALAGTATVLMTGLLARRLGAGRFGQLLAGICALVAPLYLGVHHMFSMNAFDTLFWIAALYLFVCLLDDGRPRLWLWLGVVIGLGLENKISLLFLGFGLVVGLALTSRRRLLLDPRAWLGALIAFLLLLPNIIWQVVEGWPTLEFIHNAQTQKMVELPPLLFLKEQFMLMHPLTAAVWVVGLAMLLVHPSMRRFRSLGWCYLAILALFFLQKGKPYYLGPAYPILFAAGACALERWFRSTWTRSVAVALLLATGAATIPMALPVLPVDTYIRFSEALGSRPASGERFEEGKLPSFYANMFGWEKLTALVDSVYRTLPPEDRARCGIFGQNYMQAGAIDFYGRRFGLPRAMAGHNNYWLWGIEGHTAAAGHVQPKMVIVIGGSERRLREWFEEVEERARFQDEYIQPIHNNEPIFVVRKPKVPFAMLWPKVRFYI